MGRLVGVAVLCIATVTFCITGPALAQPSMHFNGLQGEAGLSWKSMKALGCDIGPAEVKAILQQGWFQLYPIETTSSALLPGFMEAS